MDEEVRWLLGNNAKCGGCWETMPSVVVGESEKSCDLMCRYP